MNILISGADGFVGSNLLKKLLEEGSHEVYALSKKSGLQSSRKCHVIKCNLSDENFTKVLPNNVNVVVHLAQSNQYQNFPNEVDDIFKVNIIATQHLLDWSRKTGIKKFIFASSGNVYKPKNIMHSEEDACEPIGYYGATKYAAEQLMKAYNNFFQISILRLFGIYGPGQNKMTIPNIIKKIDNGN